MQLNSNTKTKTYSQKNVISDYQGETNFDVGLAATRLHDTELSCIFYVAGHKKEISIQKHLLSSMIS